MRSKNKGERMRNKRVNGREKEEKREREGEESE